MIVFWPSNQLPLTPTGSLAGVVLMEALLTSLRPSLDRGLWLAAGIMSKTG